MNSKEEYKIIISDSSKRMLETHIRFLAQVNKNSARKTKNNIIKAIRSLYIFPQRFPFFEEAYMPINKYHKMYVENYYIILFQIKDYIVYVDYIVDCRTDYKWLLK